MAAPGPYLDQLAWGFNSLQLTGNCRRSVDFLLSNGRDVGMQPRDLFAVITRAQRRLGELWRASRVTIAQEHMASAIAETALVQLHAQLPRAQPNGVAVVLDLDGFEVRFLGANVPTSALVKDVVSGRPDVVCLSVGSSFAIPSLVHAIRQMRAEVEHLLIAGGGQAFSFAPSLHRNLSLDVHGGDAESVATAIDRALSRRALSNHDGASR